MKLAGWSSLYFKRKSVTFYFSETKYGYTFIKAKMVREIQRSEGRGGGDSERLPGGSSRSRPR